MRLFGKKEKEDKSSSEWVAEGQNYYEQNKFKKALECYSQALKQDPNNVQGWADKGMANYKLAQHEEAIEDINHALDLDPQYLRGYYLKAFPLGELKSYQEAVENFEYFQANAGPEFKKELEFTEKNLENLHKFLTHDLDNYKKIFPIKESSDLASTNLKVDGRLKDSIIKIFGQKDGLRFSKVNVLEKVNENLFFIKYEQIETIEFEKGRVGGDIRIKASGIEITVNGIVNEEGSLFVGRVQERIRQHHPGQKTEFKQIIVGYDKNVGYEIEILISEEGIFLKNKKETEVPGQFIPYENIKKVKFLEGLKKGKLEIKLFDFSKIKLDKVNNVEGKFFTGVIQEKIIERKSASHKAEADKPGSDPLDEIEKAKKLLDMGAITQEQFEEIRDNYLKRI
jgi:hypothetical protein